MGVLSDLWAFDKEWMKDIWGKIEDDPERLLFGSVDPFSTELWNGVLGRDDEAMVNMLGGPMGSGWTGLGEEGGVYDTAREKGINTKWPGRGHDAAEFVASWIGGGAALDGLGNIGNAAAETGNSIQTAGLQSSGATTYPMPDTGALGGGVEIDAAGNAIGGGFDWKEFAKQGLGGMGGGGQQPKALEYKGHDFSNPPLNPLQATPATAQDAQNRKNFMQLALMKQGYM